MTDPGQVSPRAKAIWYLLDRATTPLDPVEVAARFNDMTLAERMNAVESYDQRFG